MGKKPWWCDERAARRFGWVILAAALMARTPMLTTGLKPDEYATFDLHTAHDLRGMYTSWRDHPFANFAAYASSRLGWGEEPRMAAARIPSYLAGALTVLLVYLEIVRLSRCFRAALVPTGILMFSPEHVEFSTSVRGYAIATLGAVVLHLLYLRIIERARGDGSSAGSLSGGLLAAYGVVAVCSLWSHLWIIYVLAAHGVMMVFVPVSWRSKLAFAGVQVVAVAAVIGLMWQAIPDILTGNRDDPRTRPEILNEFRWAFQYNIYRGRTSSWFVQIGFVAAVLASLRRRWPLELILSMGLIALVPIFLAIKPPGAFGTRYVLFYAPLFHQAWGQALGQAGLIPRRFLRWELYGFLVVTLLFLGMGLSGLRSDGALAEVLILCHAAAPYFAMLVLFTEWDPELWTHPRLRWVLGAAAVLAAMQLVEWLPRDWLTG